MELKNEVHDFLRKLDDSLVINDGKVPMFNIEVNKAELIEKLKANREEHRTIFESAIEGYRTFVSAKLEERIQALQRGQTIEETFRFTVPQDHTSDFDRVIGMLEMDLANQIELDEHQYGMYVDNDWDWARNFAASNAGYTQTLASSSYAKYLPTQ